PTKLTITGTIHADSTKGNFAVGTGTFAAEGAVPLSGTTGVHRGDDYEVIIAIWGTEEDAQVRDTYRFLEAISVTKKAPVETADEVVALSNDTTVASEPVTEVVLTVTIAITEVAADAVVVTESVAAVEDAPVTTEASA
ncbi:MAG TPA: hypothetical protein VIJ14_10185, partial [Rhabdochlamydiaceae bacterium]